MLGQGGRLGSARIQSRVRTGSVRTGTEGSTTKTSRSASPHLRGDVWGLPRVQAACGCAGCPVAPAHPCTDPSGTAGMLFYQLGPAAVRGKRGTRAHREGARLCSWLPFPSLCCPFRGVEVPDPSFPVGGGDSGSVGAAEGPGSQPCPSHKARDAAKGSCAAWTRVRMLVPNLLPETSQVFGSRVLASSACFACGLLSLRSRTPEGFPRTRCWQSDGLALGIAGLCMREPGQARGSRKPGGLLASPSWPQPRLGPAPLKFPCLGWGRAPSRAPCGQGESGLGRKGGGRDGGSGRENGSERP